MIIYVYQPINLDVIHGRNVAMAMRSVRIEPMKSSVRTGGVIQQMEHSCAEI